MRWERPPVHSVAVTLPAWVAEAVHYEGAYHGDEARMAVAISLAEENVARGTGGPFGAAIFERESGRLVSVGVNGVLRHNNPTVHAEMAAIQFATRRAVSFSLGATGQASHEIVSSCAPCAMCLGAVLWSGVSRLVYGAEREDAERIRFDEGPVFAESYAYLRARGIEILGGVLRERARKVLEDYVARGGPIYNG